MLVLVQSASPKDVLSSVISAGVPWYVKASLPKEKSLLRTIR